jgi:phosphatidylinositol kinase/protein kinase (PI-3  family)
LDKVFGLPWAETCEQVRQLSPYGNVKGWRLASFILKAGEDIRREALVMQVISKMKTWFDSDIPMYNRPFLKPYTIMCVGGDAGLLECLRDAKSIDEVKKSTDGYTTLRDYFERAFGPPTPEPQIGPHANGISHQHAGRGHQHRGDISFEEAQDNFLRSLVGYSLVCYILQIKDRHNANILLDREGHIMHIDFGFVLGDTPKMGKVPLFSERAPFKLTAEFWEVIGGWNFNEGGLGVRFCKMFEEAFACASTHRDELVSLIEAAILNMTQDRHEARILANGVRNRLQMRGSRGSVQQKAFIMDLVNTALTSWGTSTYDWLQKSMNGYI